jgi:prepilin-type processing-associated H-X9-DG protein
VSGWRGVVSVVTSGNHTVALFADGHVEAVGLNESGECRTEDWRRVVMIAVMPELTLGLRADGKVLAAGRHHAVLNTLEAVRAIACFGSRRQVFVMADGTLRIHNRGSEYLPEPWGRSACSVRRWRTPYSSGLYLTASLP